MGAGTDYTSTESTDAGSIIQVIKLLHPVEFTDSSTGADSVLWDFGDGDTSSERNPVHNYSSNGTFIVTLTASNQFGEDSTTQTVVVTGIGVDYYEQEVEAEETTEEETTEEETTEETTEEEATEEETDVSEVQTFIIDIPSIPEVEPPKDEEDFESDLGEFEFGDDATTYDLGSVTSDQTTTQQTTTQQTTEEQHGKKLELVFQSFSPDGLSMIGLETKDLALVEGELEQLQIGTPITIIGMESNKVHNRQVGYVSNELTRKGIGIDVAIEVQDEFYRVEAEV